MNRRRMAMAAGLIGVLLVKATTAEAQGCPACLGNSSYVECSLWYWGGSACESFYDGHTGGSWCIEWYSGSCDETFLDVAPDGRIGFGKVAIVVWLSASSASSVEVESFAEVINQVGLPAHFVRGCGGRVVEREYDAASVAGMLADTRTIVL
jgi:hypothetical protein